MIAIRATNRGLSIPTRASSLLCALASKQNRALPAISAAIANCKAPGGSQYRRSAGVRDFHSSRVFRHGDFEKQDPKSPEEVVNITMVAR